MAEWIVAAVVGVVVGWVLRGSSACKKSASAAPDSDLEAAQTQIRGLEAMVNGRDATIAALQNEIASSK